MGFLLTFTHVDNKQNLITHEHEKGFPSMDAVKEYLKDTFGNSKKTKMYIDKKDGSNPHIGYVFNRWNHYYETGKRFSESIWVTFFNVEQVILSE